MFELQDWKELKVMREVAHRFGDSWDREEEEIRKQKSFYKGPENRIPDKLLRPGIRAES